MAATGEVPRHWSDGASKEYVQNRRATWERAFIALLPNFDSSDEAAKAADVATQHWADRFDRTYGWVRGAIGPMFPGGWGPNP